MAESRRSIPDAVPQVCQKCGKGFLAPYLTIVYCPQDTDEMFGAGTWESYHLPVKVKLARLSKRESRRAARAVTNIQLGMGTLQDMAHEGVASQQVADLMDRIGDILASVREELLDGRDAGEVLDD